MDESACLSKMIAPGQVRPSKPYLGGVLQILVTSSCDKNCLNCTQMSQLRRKPEFMTPEQFEQAVLSLKGYFGVHGVFGGNPCLSPHFKDYCDILTKHVPFVQRGLWSNNPIKLENAEAARKCFNPSFSNINVHLDQKAFDLWKQGWPECRPVGLTQDSRHSPCFVAMKDLRGGECHVCKGDGSYSVHSGGAEGEEYVTCDNCDGTGQLLGDLPVFDANHQKVGTMPNTEENRLTIISDCDVNQRWSAGVGLFRGQLRGWFCEIAMAASIHHQDDPDWPDTGIPIEVDGRSTLERWAGGIVGRGLWWEQSMPFFSGQVKKHCHECSVPLRGHGENAMSENGKEQVSQTHAANYEPKRKGRTVEVVTKLVQLGVPLTSTVQYLQNSTK